MITTSAHPDNRRTSAPIKCAPNKKLSIAAEIIAIASMKLRAVGLTDAQIMSLYKAASKTKGIK